MCVVTHDEHFHNQDFTLLKSNLMFGLGFFLSLQQTLKLGMKEKGRSNMARPRFYTILGQLCFSITKLQKILSHKNQMAP